MTQNVRAGAALGNREPVSVETINVPDPGPIESAFTLMHDGDVLRAAVTL